MRADGRMTFVVNFLSGGYTIVKFYSWAEFAEWAQSRENKVSTVRVDYSDVD